MILEQLISAYLDGELTEEQDALLRSQISSDPAAREAFDSAVLIHIAMRCEDDTAAPENLRTAVFDAIDAIAQTNTTKKFSLRGAAVLAVLFAFFSLPVGESLRDAIRHTTTNNEIALVPTTSEIKHVRINRHVMPASDPAAHQETTDVAAGNSQAPVPVEERFEAPHLPESAAPATLASVFATSTPFNGNSGVAESAPADASPMNSAVPTRVTVSTTYAAGSDMLAGSASNIRQISASIGYGVAESDIVGLEVGSTSYSMDHQTNVLHARGSYPALTTQPSSTGVPGKLTSPDLGRTDYSSETVAVTSNESSAWGSAFYERKILQQKGLSLNARAGAGFGEDGALGYGRLQCEWHVGGIISVVVGGEARLMPFRTGTEPNKISSTTYGTAITALTGIHLRF